MGYIKRNKWEVLFAIFIILTFLLLRIPFILSLPIFTDEAIYIRWAQYLQTDIKFWDYALTDGKQPAFIWLITFLMSFTSDPLYAGRMASVLAGALTLIGMFFLAMEVFKHKWVGLISALLYSIYPFALVYDKMALYDSLVGTFAVWGLYLVVILARKLKLKYAIVLGIVSGMGVLNKSNGYFTIILLPVSLLLVNLNKKIFRENIIKWIMLALASGLLTFIIYSFLRLSPYYHIIEQKNAVFVYPLKEWLNHPFTFFWGNLWIGQRDWFVKYFTYPFILLAVLSFCFGKEFIREKLVLLLWFIVPFLVLALFGKTLYPRYILFMTLSLLPLVAYSIFKVTSKFNNPLLKLLFVCLALINTLYVNYLILFDFGKAPIPISDVSQYYTDWPSGYGIGDTISYLENNTKGKIALYTQGTFGLMPDAYLIYLHKNPRFKINGIWPIEDKIPDEVYKSAESMPTYVVFFQPCSKCPAKGKAPLSWSLETALEIKKPAVDAWLTLYKVPSQNAPQ